MCWRTRPSRRDEPGSHKKEALEVDASGVFPLSHSLGPLVVAMGTITTAKRHLQRTLKMPLGQRTPLRRNGKRSRLLSGPKGGRKYFESREHAYGLIRISNGVARTRP